MNPIFTIGHSDLELEVFTSRLVKHQIDVLVDVRTTPFSRFHKQFNQATLRFFLEKHKIKYLFLGKELGARSDDDSCYIDGKVSYELLAKTPLFNSGIDRISKGSLTHQLCLMCAEQDPLECHRTILVSRKVYERGHEVLHILKDGTTESHSKAIIRLRDKFKLNTPDLFYSDEQLTDKAYKIQGEKIAYIEESDHE
jgi:uncharacterized protein (DUF488 family)